MASATATVETLTAEVRVLMVGRRQVTMSVFRQLDTVDWEKWETLELFGRVRGTRKDEQRLLYVVGRVKDTGVLVRSNIHLDSKTTELPKDRRLEITYGSYAPNNSWLSYPKAVRKMRLDIALPVKYHYDMSQPQRDEAEKIVNHSRSKLENLIKARDKAHATYKEISSGELPEGEQFTHKYENGHGIKVTWRSNIWWDLRATEGHHEEKRVAAEALEKAEEDLKLQRDITENNNTWLESVKSEKYINDVLHKLDEAVADIELMKFCRATIVEWKKLPLIVLAGLT
tara:strand:- start:4 stop:861 length:858 start_codon:yes stop_codon:yes gene_type:complete